ncbi:gpK [Enterobacteria phage WA11]|uniref:GpK n=1 Tax=Enterobacteria phage WA11 TaxID=338126 RepID=Q2LLK3_BPPHX|nr:gpK [Enterobacteria phage WA11]
MSRKITLIKQELLLLVYELNRSGLLVENEKIRPILAQLEKLLLRDLSPSTDDSFKD